MLRNLLLVAASLGVAWLLGEAALWAIGYANPSFYQADAYAGFALRPGAEGWWRREGEAYIRINSHGQRDREHALAKPAHTVRVAVLGDSYAEALQLPREQTFWAVAERRLNDGCEALGERTAEFINFGVSGYGTAQELQTLRHKAWAFDPDIVVLAFLTGNDIGNNSRALEGDPMRPYFLLRDGELVLDDSFRTSEGYRLRSGWFAQLIYATINRSRVLQLVNEVRQAWRARAQKGPVQEAGLSDAVYAAPAAPAWQEAWAVTEALLRRMADEVRQRGKGFVVMTLSNGIQVHPDAEKRERFRQRLGVDDLFYPDRRIISVAAKAGATTVMTAPALRQWAEENGECVHGFANAHPCGGHWNAHGHRLAGEMLAAAICQRLARPLGQP